MSGNSTESAPIMQEQDQPSSTPHTEVVTSSPAGNSAINNNPPLAPPSCLSPQQKQEARALIFKILEQAKNDIYKALDLGIGSSFEKGKENTQEEEDDDEINTPPDQEAHEPSPRNIYSIKPLSILQLTVEKNSAGSLPSHPVSEAMAKPVKRRLKFSADDDDAQGNEKRLKKIVPGDQDQKPFLDMSMYPFLRESLKPTGSPSGGSFVTVIESSKMKELEDKWIKLWEEQVQLSMKISELSLEQREVFTDAFDS